MSAILSCPFRKYDNIIHYRSVILTAYCRRPAPDEEEMVQNKSEIQVHTDIESIPIFSFTDLLKGNTTASQLFAWGAPIDTIELYILFLSKNIMDNGTLFFNCSALPILRFGVQCEYEVPQATSFTQFVKDQFNLHKFEPLKNAGEGYACYTGLSHCERFGNYEHICLDHQEICDGKWDCVNGDDEKDCWQLEINDCSEEEYRCRNGLCIPIGFAFDFEFDCLDNSDETSTPIFRVQHFLECYFKWWIQCDAHRCTSRSHYFSCGDGTCRQISFVGDSSDARYNFEVCTSRRDYDHTKLIYNVTSLCAQFVACMLQALPLSAAENGIRCRNICPKYKCQNNISATCPKPHFIFPSNPVLLEAIYFKYDHNRSDYQWQQAAPPEYLCYDGRAFRLPPLRYFKIYIDFIQRKYSIIKKSTIRTDQ